MSDVDDFLAHYGVKGMKWGQRRAARKAKELKAREKVMRGKDGDQRRARIKKEKQLKELVDADLNPRMTAAKNYAGRILKENKGLLMTGALTAVTTAAGIAYMASNLNSSFAGISISAIPLR